MACRSTTTIVAAPGRAFFSSSESVGLGASLAYYSLCFCIKSLNTSLLKTFVRRTDRFEYERASWQAPDDAGEQRRRRRKKRRRRRATTPPSNRRKSPWHSSALFCDFFYSSNDEHQTYLGVALEVVVRGHGRDDKVVLADAVGGRRGGHRVVKVFFFFSRPAEPFASST